MFLHKTQRSFVVRQLKVRTSWYTVKSWEIRLLKTLFFKDILKELLFVPAVLSTCLQRKITDCQQDGRLATSGGRCRPFSEVRF